MTDYWGDIDISSLQGEFSSIDYFTEKDEHVKKYQEQFRYFIIKPFISTQINV
ncbi:large secreted protein [Streptococcus pneumoniae]|nr:large secreted protein [Streptococcus pneumoniae]